MISLKRILFESETKVVFDCRQCEYYGGDDKESCKFRQEKSIPDNCPLIKAYSFEGRFSKIKQPL